VQGRKNTIFVDTVQCNLTYIWGLPS